MYFSLTEKTARDASTYGSFTSFKQPVLADCREYKYLGEHATVTL